MGGRESRTRANHSQFQLSEQHLKLSIYRKQSAKKERSSTILFITISAVGLNLHHPKCWLGVAWGRGMVGSGDPNFVLHISSSWVKIRLHTENQPHVEVELDCDNCSHLLGDCLQS